MKIELVKTLSGWSVRRGGVELDAINPVDHGKYGHGLGQPLTEIQAMEVQRVMNVVMLPSETINHVAEIMTSLRGALEVGRKARRRT